MLWGIGIIQMAFVAVMMLLGGVGSYYDQMEDYMERSEKNARKVSQYLEGAFQVDGKSFLEFQNYFMEHRDEIKIPYDGFDGDWRAAEERYEKLLAERYPGLRPGMDIAFGRLDDETRKAHAIYRFEYWLHMFSEATNSFGMKYIYYIVPSNDPYHMVYVLDMDYDEETYIDGEKVLLLGDDNHEPPENHRKMWEAWMTGRAPEGHDTYDNEYGHTYAYYYPVYVEGKKMGVIGAEICVGEVKKAVIKELVDHSIGMLGALSLTSLVSLCIINLCYVSRIEELKKCVEGYTEKMGRKAAEEIERKGNRNGFFDDEISFLADRTAGMIRTLESRMDSLARTERKLLETRNLARTDALTGVLNKTAYDEAVKYVESRGSAYGIAVIDLNDLKKVNDTYGHERGDIYIKGLVRTALPLFGDSRLYRVGGDEFAVILEGSSLKIADEAEKEFNDIIQVTSNDDSLPPWERISAAIGIAVYDEKKDGNAADVFVRADKAMYERKKEMKKKRMA